MGFWDTLDHGRLIAAHRGFRAVRAENTMAAFEASIHRCDFVELDVGLSRDGIPIIIHDDSLERTSDAAELADFTPPYTTIDYSYAKLLQLDFSSWFVQKDPFGTIASGMVSRSILQNLPVQRILTLAEALSFFKYHQMPVNIEIKDMRGTDFDGVVTQKVLSAVREAGMETEVLLSSFNHAYVVEAKAMAPEISRAALEEHTHPEDVVAYLKELGADCYHCEHKIITEELVKELRGAGITVNAYTVNTPKEQERMFSWGVKSVFTDFL